MEANKMAHKKLTIMQQRFVDLFTGSATEAARLAGYKQPHSQGPRLLENVGIMEAIQQREALRNSHLIADREQRQRFWTRIMLDESAHNDQPAQGFGITGPVRGRFLGQDCANRGAGSQCCD
jgi:phage terminase small subunit